ncbi:hypothetical protein FGO68_gene3265 [Halteria grandinella]|uniref:RING-type domain-containing protein n=1 Tax=Halteria grandinella TaxID=5974 RepID=A0A8J8NX88_HALGN|nr:hypothetical protein FGO68_gene3265 [Halteria grandinella]
MCPNLKVNCTSCQKAYSESYIKEHGCSKGWETIAQILSDECQELQKDYQKKQIIIQLADQDYATSKEQYLQKIIKHTYDQQIQDNVFKRLQFTDDYSQNFDLSCIVCRTFVPQLICCTACNKRLCSPCVTKWKTTQRNVPQFINRGLEYQNAGDQCPACRAKDFKTRALSDIEKSFYDGTTVKGCPFKECSQSSLQMTLKAFRIHLIKDCLIPLFQCPNQCGLFLRKRTQFKHYEENEGFNSNQCELGYISCRFCYAKGMTNDANQKHECVGRWKSVALELEKLKYPILKKKKEQRRGEILLKGGREVINKISNVVREAASQVEIKRDGLGELSRLHSNQ